MVIRPETANEYDAVCDLVEEAFKSARYSEGDEQELVKSIRASKAYIPALSLVAVEDGELIGHIMLSRLCIRNDAGDREALIVAPLSVSLPFRSLGVGTALMHAALEKARELGCGAVLLLGNPEYYHRFGYGSAPEFGITSVQTRYPDGCFMALALTPDGLRDMDGVVDFDNLY